jgi:hypothetical protein
VFISICRNPLKEKEKRKHHIQQLMIMITSIMGLDIQEEDTEGVYRHSRGEIDMVGTVNMTNIRSKVTNNPNTPISKVVTNLKDSPSYQVISY